MPSKTRFSIARHFGGISFNGESYTYFSDTDELVRDDVLKWQNNNKSKVKHMDIKSKSDIPSDWKVLTAKKVSTVRRYFVRMGSCFHPCPSYQGWQDANALSDMGGL